MCCDDDLARMNLSGLVSRTHNHRISPFPSYFVLFHTTGGRGGLSTVGFQTDHDVVRYAEKKKERKKGRKEERKEDG